MNHAVQSLIAAGCAVLFVGVFAYSIASMFGRESITIETWLARIAAIVLFAFLCYGTFMTYKDAFMLSRHGTSAIAHATFKRSYLPRRRVSPVFVYDMAFDEHRVEKEYHYRLNSTEVPVVYDPSAPDQFMIGEANGSAIQLLRSDMKEDFWFVYIWPVFVLVAAAAVVFSWKKQPPPNAWATEVVD